MQVTYEFSESCSGCDKFNLNENTGEVTAASTFDREEASQYILTVIAKDGAESSIAPGGPNTGASFTHISG